MEADKPDRFSSVVATEKGNWSELSLSFCPGFTFDEFTDVIQKRTQE